VLRKMLEQKVGTLSDAEFKAALAIATMEIKHNRIGRMRMTTMPIAINIASCGITALRTCHHTWENHSRGACLNLCEEKNN
jgi:uncharacterized membrane protein